VDRPPPNQRQQRVLDRVSACPGNYIIGIDEVGVGSCAGPIFVCGVLSDRHWDHELAQDSKKLTARKRERGYAAFLQRPPGIHAALLASFDADEVDALSVASANRALTQYIAQQLFALATAPVVLDGDQGVRLEGIPLEYTFTMVAADAIVPASGAASVLAKVSRDAQMDAYDEVFAGYGFKKNKGYLTAAHEEGLKRLGASAIHRLSYKPVRKYVLNSKIWQSRQQPIEMRAWTSWLLR
jgi:ribonuclease HII